jgi:hypothetical protein
MSANNKPLPKVWVPVNQDTGELAMNCLKQADQVRPKMEPPWQWKQFRLVPVRTPKAATMSPQMLWHLREAVGRGRRVSSMIFEKHRRGLEKRDLIDKEGYPTDAGRNYIQNHPLDGI